MLREEVTAMRMFPFLYQCPLVISVVSSVCASGAASPAAESGLRSAVPTAASPGRHCSVPALADTSSRPRCTTDDVTCSRVTSSLHGDVSCATPSLLPLQSLASRLPFLFGKNAQCNHVDCRYVSSSIHLFCLPIYYFYSSYSLTSRYVTITSRLLCHIN